MGYCNFATVLYKLRFFIKIERVNAPALGAGGLTLLKYTNKKSWYKLYQLKITYFIFFVGVAGFEPTTPCSQSRCANRTALHPATFLKGCSFQKRCKDREYFLINNS